MRKINWISSVIILLLPLLALALVDNPPSLTNYQQFYGTVNGITTTGYQLKASVSGHDFMVDIAVDGKYGYSPTFKVSAEGSPNVNFFVVDSLGVATAVGSPVVYQKDVATNLDFTYAVTTLPPPPEPQANTTPESPPEPQPITPTETPVQTAANEDNDSYIPPPAPIVNETPIITTCRQNWQCGSWSLCRTGRQTRVCYQIDSCNTLPVNTTQIITTPKPEEQQICQEEVVVATGPVKICTFSAKRCVGQQLQQCSYDGLEWTNMEYCAAGCDTLKQKCKEEVTVKPVEAAKPLPMWAYYLGGSLVLVIIIVITSVAIINKKNKYTPIKEYIAQSRAKNYSDQQIRAMLLSQGWDTDIIDKLLK